MKLRTVLNGIAALAVVGGLYTFAFCMKDEVNTEQYFGKVLRNFRRNTADRAD